MGLRFVFDNAADVAQISGASVPLMPVSNLQREGRAVRWRHSGTSAQITLMWPTAAPEYINAIALIGSNLSEQSTWRIRAWRGGVQTYDSGTQAAVPPLGLGEMEWAIQPLAVTSYWLRSRLSVVWPEEFSADTLLIELDDPTNSDGFLQASRLVCGLSWSPQFGEDWGGSWRMVYEGRRERMESGDPLIELSSSYRVLSLSLPAVDLRARNVISEVYRRIGPAKPFLVSLMPTATDKMQESDYTIWGLLPMEMANRYQSYQRWATSIDIEEA